MSVAVNGSTRRPKSLFTEDVHDKRCGNWLTRNTTRGEVYDLTADQTVFGRRGVGYVFTESR